MLNDVEGPVDHLAAEPASSLLWRMDPIRYALDASAKVGAGRAAEVAPHCTEVGRRLLLAQFRYSEWILRRVEKVQFEHERRISRKSSIELVVPENAPVVIDDRGNHLWLVPLSVMRRRTLVHLDLRDEDGRSMSLLGLRFTQKLDEAVLRAAARLVPAAAQEELPTDLTDYISQVVSGDWATVKAARDTHAQKLRDRVLGPYLSDDVFSATLERLWHNFTLYVTLPVERGRHRLLRMSFDEPVDWHYQTGILRPLTTEQTARRDQPESLSARDPEPGEAVVYQPFALQTPRARAWTRLTRIPALLGIQPTRIRFLTPSAENCASYHFEFSAPPDVRVSRARLLAGRPNRATEDVCDPKLSADGVDNHGEMVGLHAVEIPSWSLCRVQVDLRISTRGWLTTLLFACLAIVAVLLVTTLTLPDRWQGARATQIFVFSVTISAGAATYVAQQSGKDVAARMLTWLRGVGAVVISIPVISGATVILLTNHVRDHGLGGWLWAFWSMFSVATIATLVVFTAWLITMRDERSGKVLSPWDMTKVGVQSARPLYEKPAGREPTYAELVEAFAFDSKAVGVHSSEGWHELYTWDAAKQEMAIRRLSVGKGAPRNPTGCSCTGAVHLPLVCD